MDIGTFARLGPEPLTYHLKESESHRETDTLADTFLSLTCCFELHPEQTLITHPLTYQVQLSNTHDISGSETTD